MKKLIVLILLLLAASALEAKIELPRILGDNMVLQRNTVVNLWGKAAHKSKVTITTSWNDKSYTVRADSDGRWKAGVETCDAGGPYSISISDGDVMTIGNIFLGEVWVCSGQSNMEMPVRGYPAQPCDGSEQAILEAGQYPFVRMFTVERNSSSQPQSDCKGGEWLISSSETAAEFSAAAYFFGITLNRVLNIPIGLVSTNWGGSSIETWMSEEAIISLEDIDQDIAFSGKDDNNCPGLLFNGMVLPIADYTAKGFIWYQGESNRHNPKDYPHLMAKMVSEWRKLWGDEQMPFYYVQIAPYYYEWRTDGFEQPMMAEAQYKAHSMIPYSGVVPTIDIGHKSCIHPPQKPVVGRRLAYHALSKDYGVKGFVADAPAFESMRQEGKKLVLTFSNLSNPSGNNSSNSFSYFDAEETRVLKGFEIAGADRFFYPAKANFQWWKDCIEVYSDEVDNPIAVRYAFRNVSEANIMTVSGLPLPSFRTDDWPVEIAETR